MRSIRLLAVVPGSPRRSAMPCGLADASADHRTSTGVFENSLTSRKQRRYGSFMQTPHTSAADAPPLSGAVDVHHHAVPDDYRRALADAGLLQSVDGVDFPAWDVAASL